ncbi:type VI secretion system protein TssL, long form [Paraburkholderia sp. D15]|uniref:type VI secretion system protein TssL, long form n=1 Tax=Paraburkholderia sp. D15 TaxID=2880218 RepID=UPI0024793F11|nr:type VI secretion system protein TssL, long form [Paraburkholderia sp. D15]WGS49455.1 type VI secretion system protein TssL, long form [Paraburkholderia sp. D15]
MGQAAPADSTRHGSSERGNALLAAANPLLDLLVPIRTRVDLAPQRVRAFLIDQLRTFQARARQAAVPVETIVAARYCLCTALDEAAALAPWGGGGAWSTQSLLVAFHKETWGGEKFFQLLARVSANSHEHRDLIELQYFCLMLGFQGRYRVIENGAAQRDTLMRRLHKLLHENGGGYAQPLSPAWRAADRAPLRRLRRGLPLWTWLLIGGLGGGASFGALLLATNAHAGRIAVAIETLRLPELDKPAAAITPAPATLLRQSLGAQLRDGTLILRDEADRSVIAMRGDGLFDSGSAGVNPAYLPVLAHLAVVLSRLDGDIVITGHTDDQPIRDRRFASNLALSQARAVAVRQGLLAAGLDAGRNIAVAGRGDSQPVADNRSADGRSQNRRVEIAVFSSNPGQSGVSQAAAQ